MEVATALLDASRRLSSGSNESTTSGSPSTWSATASWSSSVGEDTGHFARGRTVSLTPYTSAVIAESARRLNEQNDKTGDLPSSNSWMGSWTKRTRTTSESENVNSNLGSWLGGLGAMRERANTGPVSGTPSWGQSGFMGTTLGAGPPRIRRSSSKDVEEAMAGGLSKTEIFMPPM